MINFFFTYKKTFNKLKNFLKKKSTTVKLNNNFEKKKLVFIPLSLTILIHSSGRG